MIYTIEELLQEIKDACLRDDNLYLLKENVDVLAGYLETVAERQDQNVQQLLVRIAWLEATIKRAAQRVDMAAKELDAACLPS